MYEINKMRFEVLPTGQSSHWSNGTLTTARRGIVVKIWFSLRRQQSANININGGDHDEIIFIFDLWAQPLVEMLHFCSHSLRRIDARHHARSHSTAELSRFREYMRPVNREADKNIHIIFIIFSIEFCSPNLTCQRISGIFPRHHLLDDPFSDLRWYLCTDKIRAWTTLLSVLQYIQCIVPMPYYKNLSSATHQKFQPNTLLVPKLYTKRQLILPYRKTNFKKKRKLQQGSHQHVLTCHPSRSYPQRMNGNLPEHSTKKSRNYPQRMNGECSLTATLNARMHCAH